MSDRMLFVLHGLADEKYAADLAAELGGLSMAHGAAPVRFGANIICVQVWSGTTSAASLPDNTVICRLGGAPLPFGRHAYDAEGSASVDALALRPLITTLQKQLDESATRSRGTAPRLGAAPQALADRRKPPLAVRSAAGMAVTLGVAGVIAPMIMERAQATSTTSTPPTAQSTAPLAVTPPPVADPAPVSATPAVDRWLTEEPAQAPHHAAPLAASTADVTPRLIPAVADGTTLSSGSEGGATLVPIADLVAPVLDPKLMGLSAETGASAGGALLDTERLSAKGNSDAVRTHRTVLP